MAAAEVTERLVAAIGAGYDLIVVNFANPDMVGHGYRKFNRPFGESGG